MLVHQLLVWGLVSCCSFLGVESLNAGMVMEISEKGLQHLSQQAVDELSKGVKGTKLPNNNVITSFTTPAVTVSIGQQLQWTFNKIGLQIQGNYQFKWIIKTYSGRFTLTLSSWSVHTSLNTGIDSYGRPTLKLAKCLTTIGNINIKYSKYVGPIMKNKILKAAKQNLQQQICEKVKTVISVNMKRKLSTLKMTMGLPKNMELDYRLIKAAQLTRSSINTQLKGEVYWRGDRQEAPFRPPAEKLTISGNRAVGVAISQYTLNTAGYVQYKHHNLQYTLSKQQLPKQYEDFLKTTCNGTCIGRLIPELSKYFPGTSVQLNILATSSPQVVIKQDGISSVVYGQVKFSVQFPNKTIQFAFSAISAVNFTMLPRIKGGNVTATVQHFKIEDLAVDHSNIGNVSLSRFNSFIPLVSSKILLPKLQELGAMGVLLPKVDKVHWIQPQLSTVKNAVVFSTDVNI